MKSLITLALLTVASASFAGTYYYDNSLTTNSPTFANPGGSTAGTAVQYYNVFQFTVTASGAYNFETASPNTSTGNSNALDTFLLLYTGSFNPLSPAGPTQSNDDFTGTLTVLPGPYAGTVGTSGTGFTGAQPASRFTGVSLVTGVQYFLVNSSFRSTDYVNTGSTAGPMGHFYTGISGVGDITAAPVPEPASMAALGLGVMAMLRRRKKNA